MENLFNQKYETLQILGKGGQGFVEQCRNRSTNQLFAVKKTKGDLTQLQNEIDIQASVGSKYIVKMIEVISNESFITHESFIYIVLEYCNGKTLQEKSQKEIFSEKDIYDFLKFILKAQYELIQMGIIHRDLKPNNILIHDGQYKLADFGISRHVYNYDQAGQITAFTTPSQYRSPQFQTRKYSSKCDVWSLGIIMYYLFFKQYPWVYDQENKGKYYNDCKTLSFPQGRAISSGLRELIQGCLAYEEKDRFSWTDLMKRKILGYEFDDYIKLEQKLKNIELSLAQKMIKSAFQHSTINQFKNDTDNLQKDKRERIVDFQKRARKYNNQLESFQIVYIFNQIDQKHKEYIDAQQNENWITSCKQLLGQFKKLQIQFADDRIIIKKLFVMIYFKLQDDNYNIYKLIDQYECVFEEKRQGFILANQFQSLFQKIDQSIQADEIQTFKQYFLLQNDITLGKYIQTAQFAQIYEQFWRVNLLELRFIYQSLNSYQQIEDSQSERYRHFINLFDKKIIDRYISLDLEGNWHYQNNLDDLNKEIQRIKELNIQQ